jgi:predicted nucleic acid-binding protein
MSESLNDVFADSAYWIALIVRHDAYHDRAMDWTKRIRGRIVTTDGVLIETTSALAVPPRRIAAVNLMQRLREREDIEIVQLDPTLLNRGWILYCDRMDKAWSWVDCTSFTVMKDRSLHDALTTDRHFVQAGFRAVLLES